MNSHTGKQFNMPCDDCKGTGLVSVAYDVLRSRYKILTEKSNEKHI